MPEIKITIPDFGSDLSKRISGLESVIKNRPTSDLSRDISDIRKIVSKQDSALERRLARIEDLLKDIPDVIKNQNRGLGNKIDSIEFKSDYPKIRKIIGESTSQIMDMMSSMPHHKPEMGMKKMMSGMEESISSMEKKLSRLSLPRNIIIYAQKGQTVVPSPS